MDLIPADMGGDDYYLNGSYVKLKDAGTAYGANAVAVREKAAKQGSKSEDDDTQDQDADAKEEEQPESKNHAERHAQRKKGRRNG